MEGSGVGVELWSRNSHGGAIFGDWHDCPGVGNSARYEPPFCPSCDPSILPEHLRGLLDRTSNDLSDSHKG